MFTFTLRQKRPAIKSNTVGTVLCKGIAGQSIVLPQSSAKLNFPEEQLGIKRGVNNDPNMCLLAKQSYELD